MATALTHIFSISCTKTGDVVTNLIAKALLERIIRAAREGQKFKVTLLFSFHDGED
jgi:phospholipase D1/2